MRGRTYRRRNRNKKITPSVSLDNDASIINLKKWMKSKNWRNFTLLKLKTFPSTSRGLCSSLRIKSNDTLIEIPYELMVTTTTLDFSELNKAILLSERKNLKLQDALSIFLVFQRHKGKKSQWNSYIESLPKENPPMPWLCASEELKLLPFDVLKVVQEKLDLFEESWKVARKSIDPMSMCSCCQTLSYSLLTKALFTWAYVMVNTRSVYIAPYVARQLAKNSDGFAFSLADEPSMALCPFLDMFNHSSSVGTQTKLEEVSGKVLFSLISLTNFEKDEEIFISYGDYGNLKLMLEYGFFIPNDNLNEITVTLQEILNVSKIEINERQYKFIKGKRLDENLTLTSAIGLSFHLKAVLFVVLNPFVLDWCLFIFKEDYNGEVIVKMFDLVKVLIQFRISDLSDTLSKLKTDVESPSESMANILNYLEHKLSFMAHLKENIFQSIIDNR